MTTALRIILYLVLVWYLYGPEKDTNPVLLYRRFMYTQSWSLAAYTQKVAINNYHKYREEVEANA
jgi:hypothetical protein